MPIVDGAAHVWSSDLVRFPWQVDPDEVPHGAIEGDAELLSAELDGSGSLGAVLVQPRVYGADHSYLGSIVAASGGRFAGVALWPEHVDAATMRDVVMEYGLAGVRLSAETDTSAPWFDGAGGEPAWALAEQAGLVVSVLCTVWQLDGVRAWARRVPRVPIVVDHLGLVGPDGDPRALLDLVREHDNVSVRLSALAALSGEPYPYRDLWSLLGRLWAAAGSTRLVYGTDWPFIDPAAPYPATIAALAQALPWTEDERERVLGGNAMRLWKVAGA